MTRSFDAHDRGTPEAAWAASARLAAVPAVALEDLLAGGSHLVVVAAHPDDETLGAGGLVAAAAAGGARVDVVVATRGEASHPASPTTTSTELATRRAGEVARAVAALAPTAVLHLLQLPDGALATTAGALRGALAPLVEPGAVVAAPWRGDAHPDHEVAGAVAADVAAAAGTPLLEYPVWAWHWADPDGDDLPWAALVRLPLDPAARAAKAAATAEHASQVLPLSDAPGDEAVVEPWFAAHFERDHEVFARSALAPDPS